MSIRNTIEERYDYDIIEDFLNQNTHVFNVLEKMVLDLRQEESFTPIIGELFRAFHNLKSAAGYLDVFVIVNLAKFTEDILEGARNLKGRATDEFIDWMLLVLDQVRLWLDDIERNRPDFSPINKEILLIPLDIIE